MMCDMDEALAHDIAELRSWAVATLIIRRLWIFGSRARGNDSPESDLDIALECDMRPGDEGEWLTADSICEEWEPQLQVRMRLKLDLRSSHVGAVANGLRESSTKIYERT